MIDLNILVLRATDFIWGWPLVIYICGIGAVITVALNFVQFRYFVTAWRYLLTPQAAGTAPADMTPLQAFVNALSASVGNGSIAGMATALVAGGPGAALWVVVLGFLGMAIRFCEVYLSISYTGTSRTVLGGPMVYLSKVPGGQYLPSLYAFFCMMLGFVVGNGMQSNSVTRGFVRASGSMLDFTHSVGLAPATFVAIVLLLFIVYVMLGGAQRIVKVSDAIVPVKVGVFFVSAVIVLAYHYHTLGSALYLIVQGAFNPAALAGGALGYSVQSALRFGVSRVSNANEAGLGTAGILFGATGSVQPVREGIMSMISTFISSNLVCFVVMLMIVASGVWNNGLNGLELTQSAYETVFGGFGAWLVAVLSVSFGLGVLVTYAYITRACWLFLTGGRYEVIYTVLFCAMTYFGSVAKVDLIWNSTDLINSGLLAINLFGILWLLPNIRRGLALYRP